MKNHLLSLCPNKKISLIGSGSACGIDLNVYSRQNYIDSTYRLNHGIKKEDFVLVYIGRPEKRKGFNFLLSLWNSLPDCRDMILLLCGPSREDVLKAIGYIPANVIATGFVKNIPEILAISDCLVLPSAHEGLSYAVLEAMACECVVIGSDIDGIRNLITHEKSGYLASNLSEDIYKELIFRVRSSKDCSSSIKKEALLSVQKYSRTTFISNYIQFIQDFFNKTACNLGVSHRSMRNDASSAKRLFDLLLSIVSSVCLLIPIMIVVILVRITSKGPILYWSSRIGKNGKTFQMPKFRTMRVDTPELATHLLENPEQWLTPIGPFLRVSSIDELPQLWSILKGDMSFVGPRPALFNQHDLIHKRKNLGIDRLRPGLTGWAQVNGRDAIGLEKKLEFDAQYLRYQSFWFDLYIAWLTFIKVISRENISH